MAGLTISIAVGGTADGWTNASPNSHSVLFYNHPSAQSGLPSLKRGSRSLRNLIAKGWGV